MIILSSIDFWFMAGMTVCLLGIIYYQVIAINHLKDIINNNAHVMASKFNELYKEVFGRENEIVIEYEEDEDE